MAPEGGEAGVRKKRLRELVQLSELVPSLGSFSFFFGSFPLTLSAASDPCYQMSRERGIIAGSDCLGRRHSSQN